MEIFLNKTIHYILSVLLAFIVFAEFVQPSAVNFVYNTLGPVTYLIGNNLNSLVDISVIAEDKQEITAYLALLYLVFFGLYGTLYFRVLQEFKETRTGKYPIGLRSYYQFQCLTLYRDWAPLMFPHFITSNFFANYSFDHDGNEKSCTFLEALGNYAKREDLWFFSGLLLLGLYFFLAHDPSFFLNRDFLHIPISFKLVAFILISVQLDALFNILLLLSAAIAIKIRRST